MFSDESGTCTDSGNGDVGSGFCDDNALVPKLARVGVVASSIGRGVWLGAVLGLGVMGDVMVSSIVVSAGANDVLTGRNVVAISGMGACGGEWVSCKSAARMGGCRRGPRVIMWPAQPSEAETRSPRQG